MAISSYLSQVNTHLFRIGPKYRRFTVRFFKHTVADVAVMVLTDGSVFMPQGDGGLRVALDAAGFFSANAFSFLDFLLAT